MVGYAVTRRGLVRAVSALMLIICLWATGIASAEVTIKFLAGNIDPEALNQVIKGFEKENPGINVSPQYVAWNETDSKFLTMLAGGQAPDVFLNNSVYGWARYAYEGLFVDLKPYIDRDKKEIGFEDFWPSGWRSATVGGRLTSMPTRVIMGTCVMYNANLLDEAGLALPPADWEDKSWNWDRMVEYAGKLTKVGADGKATQFGVDFWDADNLIQYAWAFGGDWFDSLSYKNGIINKVTLYTPENVRAYQAVADLRVKYKVRPGGPVVSTTPIGGVGSFNGGKIAMWIDPGWLPAGKDYRWGIAPFPYPADMPRDRAFAWFESLAIVSGTKHPEEAWKFVKYMASDKAKYLDKNPESSTYNKMVPWFGYGPRKSTWTVYINQWMERRLSALPVSQVLKGVTGALERSVALPRCTVTGATEVWNALNRELGPALRGQVPVDAALQRAQKAAEESIRNLNAQLKK